MKKNILYPSDDFSFYQRLGGGKALGLKRLIDAKVLVPQFFVVTNDFFAEIIDLENPIFSVNETDDLVKKEQEIAYHISQINFCQDQTNQIYEALLSLEMNNSFLAIRSSGHDEDSKQHSFAGQFSSFLFQKGAAQVEKSLKNCFQSAFSQRVLNYRRANNLSSNKIKMSVVVTSSD
jgi:pyruvate,water dikinase